MSHSKFIVIKCPACGEKFEAEREEEATFISCPECEMQVKISGTHERKARTPRRLSPAGSIPSRRSNRDAVAFSDLASGPVDFDSARKRAQQRLEKEELIIGDEDEEGNDKEAPKSEQGAGQAEPGGKAARTKRSSIERRAAKLEERAAKLEERAAKLAKLKGGSTADDLEVEPKKKPESAAEEQAETSGNAQGAPEKSAAKGDTGKPSKAPKKGGEKKAEPSAGDSKKADKEAEEADKEAPDTAAAEMEKVEVRSSGERRRLRKAPKAKVPEPRGRPGAPRYVDNLRVEAAEAEEKESVEPKQEFDERKVTEGAEWRRHQPNRAEAPDWEDEDDTKDEEKAVYPSQRRLQAVLWGIGGAIAIIALVAGYRFILVQIGWLEPDEVVETDAPMLLQDPAQRLTKAQMFSQVTPVIHSFLGSTSNEEALQYVRYPGQVARFMKRHYMPGDFEPVEIEEVGPLDKCEVERKGGLFLTVPVTLSDFSTGYMTLEYAETGAGYEWLVDWESWEGYSEMGFAEMRVRQPRDPVLVRCFVLEDYYYNYEFDQENYRSLKVYDHERKDQLWGYIKNNTEPYQAAALVFGTEGNVGEQRATLKLRFPKNSVNNDHDQVEVVEFEHGWIVRR